MIVNGHGGNTAALAAAGECLAAEGRRLVVIPCAFNRGDAHAGRTETSVMLALAPDLVRIDLAEPGAVEGWPALRDRVLAGGVASVSPNGVLGDPTGAITRGFDVMIEEEGLALRGTFVVDPEGRIKVAEIHDLGIGRDATELLRKVKAAQYVATHPGEVCPAKWQEGDATLAPSLDLVGKI